MDKPNFTVAELIEELQKFPQDIPVFVTGFKSGYDNFYLPRLAELSYQPENMYYDGKFQNVEEDESNTIRAVVLERENTDD
ncbi:MAG: hypothetical protein JEY91_14550 [Spirochaetaceae bacterium]|nr:hypothetical protein [Spirochaetaceae bacterium]